LKPQIPQPIGEKQTAFRSGCILTVDNAKLLDLSHL